MNAQQNYDDLKQRCLGEGVALFGVADVTALRERFLLPPEIASRFTYGISLGYRLSGAVLDTLHDAPNQMYYFHYQRINILLDQTALKVTAAIQAQGYEALPIPASQVMDWENQRGSVSHRDIAYHAGLGWYGKNNLLVTPEWGSQVRYATVLTGLPLVAGIPRAASCDSCTACVAVCPAQAISESGFDREACHRQLKEFMKTQKIGQMICGLCVKACRGTARRSCR